MKSREWHRGHWTVTIRKSTPKEIVSGLAGIIIISGLVWWLLQR
ncbi:hypothetical protein [Schleiferilactobacillus perolens]|jgi:hypothetical protein|nr:hypothetical protein [Schleiferilactobacillus perolens]